jgi:hypothetical protein
MKENYIENSYAEYWIENEMIYGVFKPGLIISIDIAQKMVQDRLKSSDKVNRPALIDIRNLVSIDDVSRKYLAGEEGAKFLTAGAFIVDSNPISRFAANIFIKLDKPPIPTKLFNDSREALKWLQKFKQKVVS